MTERAIGLLGILLIGPAAASANCPDFTKIAAEIRRDSPLKLEPMPDPPCTRVHAIAEIAKITAPLTERIESCLNAEGENPESCGRLAVGLASIVNHLKLYNQSSAYSSLCDALRKIDPTMPSRQQAGWSALRGLMEKITAEKPNGDLEKLQQTVSALTDSLVRVETTLQASIENHRHNGPGPPLRLWPWMLLGFFTLLLASTASALHWPKVRQRFAVLRTVAESGESDLKNLARDLQAQFSALEESCRQAPELATKSIEARLQTLASEDHLAERVRTGAKEVLSQYSEETKRYLKASIAKELRAELEPSLRDAMAAHLAQGLTSSEDSLKRELGKGFNHRLAEELSALEKKVSSQVLRVVQDKIADDKRAPELASLAAAWSSFRRREELQNLANEFGNIDKQEETLRTRLERNLGGFLAHSTELGRLYEIALAPLESYLFVIRKIANLVADVRAGESQGVTKETPIQRIHEGLQLLTLLQASDLATRLRQFTFRNWLKEDFRRFAEVFFQTLARQGSKSENLEQARAIIEESLGFVGFKPMSIILGRTPFDSSRHVGRGTDRFPDKDDGVIIGIVRYGFEDLQGNVLQPAEVIVNRRS